MILTNEQCDEMFARTDCLWRTLALAQMKAENLALIGTWVPATERTPEPLAEPWLGRAVFVQGRALKDICDVTEEDEAASVDAYGDPIISGPIYYDAICTANYDHENEVWVDSQDNVIYVSQWMEPPSFDAVILAVIEVKKAYTTRDLPINDALTRYMRMDAEKKAITALLLSLPELEPLKGLVRA